MVVEHTAQGILIKTDAPINIKVVQRILDYCTAVEISSCAQATQQEVDELAREINKNWWAENKHRFIK